MASRNRTLSFLVILSALMAFTSLSTDIYLPALPVMERTLGGDAELTVTGFLIGFAIAQLVWGPVSDRIGRKLPLFLGMVLFVIGSVGCALSQSMAAVVFWRVFQALGACVGPMLSRAMIRDLFGSTRAAQMLSTLTMLMAAAPIVGPLIGGLLLKVASWHAHFWLLAVIGVAMFFAVSRLPETLPPHKRADGSLWTAFARYRQLLTNRAFMRYTLCVTFFYVAVYAACANAAALASVEKTIGGAAAALIGALQYGSGIVSSLLLAAFSDGTPRAMTGLIALFVGLSALMAMGGRRVVV
jgi:proP protein